MPPIEKNVSKSARYWWESASNVSALVSETTRVVGGIIQKDQFYNSMQYVFLLSACSQVGLCQWRVHYHEFASSSEIWEAYPWCHCVSTEQRLPYCISTTQRMWWWWWWLPDKYIAWACIHSGQGEGKGDGDGQPGLKWSKKNVIIIKLLQNAVKLLAWLHVD